MLLNMDMFTVKHTGQGGTGYLFGFNKGDRPGYYPCYTPNLPEAMFFVMRKNAADMARLLGDTLIKVNITMAESGKIVEYFDKEVF